MPGRTTVLEAVESPPWNVTAYRIARAEFRRCVWLDAHRDRGTLEPGTQIDRLPEHFAARLGGEGVVSEFTLSHSRALEKRDRKREVLRAHLEHLEKAGKVERRERAAGDLVWRLVG
jgi:hypothetical protein